MIKQKEI